VIKGKQLSKFTTLKNKTMKKIVSSLLALMLLVSPKIKAQFYSIPNCGAQGVGHSIFFINSDTGYVAGESNGKGVIQKTTNGGTSWTNSYTSSSNLEWVEDVTFTNPSNGCAVGWNGSILTTNNGGATWTRQTIPAVNHFNSVCFPTASIGYAAGVGSPQGPIYKTTNGGTTWTAQTSNADSSLRSIFFLNADTGYAFGNNDVVKTINGGITWVRSNNAYPISDPDAEHLEMFCTNANTCYLPGAPPQVSTNGGSTWGALGLPFLPTFETYYITAINFTSASTGFAVGAIIDMQNSTFTGTLLKSTDAGQTWYDITTTANYDSLQNSRVLSSVKFPNAQVGYTTGMSGIVLKTGNAGGVTGIAKYNTQNSIVHIYPNPAQNKITIDANDVADVKLFDVLGKQIFSTKTNDVDVSNFNDGVYFIQVQTKQNTTTQKIMIQH
jgi:photosystem II stability/assembly factor-like uncharacterized protein